MKKGKVVISKNGPYVVYGSLPLSKEIIEVDKDDCPVRWKKGELYPKQECYSLCRCGNSKNKPFCDGSHVKTNFNGTETASRERYLKQANTTSGPNLNLTDSPALCSNARFCHRSKGTWKLTEESDNPKSKEIAIQEACDCPSGRLVAWEKNGKAIEPNFKPSVSLVEDPSNNVSGPIWLKGKIPIESSDGKTYEVRNRCTLCRCGNSKNKPFCDGSHVDVGFKDS